MRILIVNDDGIKAPGIRKLAELSMQLGEVWVCLLYTSGQHP